MSRNFTLSNDLIKQVVEQFTRSKTMEVVNEALGPDPHWKEDVLPLAIMGLHSEGVAKEAATGSVDEVGALETAQDNLYNFFGTHVVYMLSSHRSSKEEKGLILLEKTLGPHLRGLPFPSLEEKEKVGQGESAT